MNKQIKVLAIFLFYLTSNCYAMDTMPVWAKLIDYTKNKLYMFMDEGYCIDKENNSFVIKSFNDSLWIGDSVFVNTDKRKVSFILIKFDNAGNISWMYPVVNKSNVRAKYVRADNNGGCYISGMYYGELPISPGHTLDSTQTFGRSFLASFNSQGQLSWAQGYAVASPMQITASSSGNIFIKRDFNNTSPFQIGDTLIYSSSKETVAKFDATGKFYWAKTIDPCGGITIDPFENIFLVGNFNSSITIDTFTISAQIAGRSDIFIAKFNSAFKLQWIRHFQNIGKTSDVSMTDQNLTFDDIGNLYLGNGFTDSFKIFGQTWYSPGYKKIFFIKLSTDNKISWIKVPDGFQPYSEGVQSVNYSSNKMIKAKVRVTSATNFNGHVITNTSTSGSAFIEMDTSGFVNHLRPLILDYYTFSGGSAASYFQFTFMNKGESIKVQGKNYTPKRTTCFVVLKYDTSYYSSIASQYENSNGIILFPNPANTTITISTTNTSFNSVQVYNALGQLSESYQHLNTPFFQVDVTGYPRGMYFLKIETNSGLSEVKKILCTK